MNNKDYKKLYNKYKKKYLEAKKNLLINLPIAGAAAAAASKKQESDYLSKEGTIDDYLWKSPNSLFELNKKIGYAGKYKLSASQLYSYNNNSYKSKNSSRTTLLQQNFPTSFKISLNKFGNELLVKQGKSPVEEHTTKDDIMLKLVDSMPLLCGNGPPSDKETYRIKIGDYHEVVLNNRTGESNRPLIRDFIDEKSGKVRYTFYGPEGKFQKAITQSLEENANKFGFPNVEAYLDSLTPFKHTVKQWNTAIKNEVSRRCNTQSGTLHEAEEINETNGCGGVYNFSGDVSGRYEPDLYAPNEDAKWFHKLEGEKFIIFGMFDGRVTKAQYMQDAEPVVARPGNVSFFKFGGHWKTKDKSESRVSHIYEAKERQRKLSGIKENELVQIAAYHEMIKIEQGLILPVMLVETMAVINEELGYRESAAYIKNWQEGEAERLVKDQVVGIIEWLDNIKEGGYQSVKELIKSVIW